MSSQKSRKYKVYFQPGIDKKQRKIPRSTIYYRNKKGRPHAEENSVSSIETTTHDENRDQVSNPMDNLVEVSTGVEESTYFDTAVNERFDATMDEFNNTHILSTAVNESTNFDRSQGESFIPPMDEFEEISTLSAEADDSTNLDTAVNERFGATMDEFNNAHILSTAIDVSTNLDTAVNESFDATMDEFEDTSLPPAGVDNRTEKDFLFPDDHSDVEYEFRNCMKKKDIMAMILTFALRFKVSDSGVKSLINMINVIVGQELINNSLYLLFKTFNANNQIVEPHFFCPTCFSLLTSDKKKSSVFCNVCQVEVPTGNMEKSCFLSLSIKTQIESLIKSGKINLEFVSKFNEGNADRNLSDINDGQLYMKLKKKSNLFLTYNFSVDGVAAFKNAKGSLWPILLTINELEPEIRFNNVILAGLWFGKKEPNMNLFLAPFVKEATELATKGISVEPGRILHVFAACCCSDSVARPCLQNSTQYNGYYGCSWCKHPGYLTGNHQTIKYVYHDTLLFPDRTEKETVRLMNQATLIHQSNSSAQRQRNSVLGIKGPSPLLPIPYFNVVDGFAPDTMHGIYLGVTKQLVNAWFDSTKNACDYYVGSSDSCLEVINDRMKQIIMPRNVGRVPRAITERNLYKASEWRNFLIYMCLPVMKGLLKEPFFSHINSLVAAVRILIANTITMKILKKADELILEFVSGVQALYGDEFMTFNVHQMLHFTTSVVNWGPLWCHSMFVYEGYNAKLLKFYMGTTGLKSQIVRRFLLEQELLKTENQETTKNRKTSLKVGEYQLFGAPVESPSNFPPNILDFENEVKFFQKMTRNNLLFTVQTKKQFQTCDSVVFTDSEVGEIAFIAVRKNIEVLICLKKYDLISPLYQNIEDMYAAKKSDTFILVNADKIVGKCAVCNDGSFFSVFKVPSSFERS